MVKPKSASVRFRTTLPRKKFLEDLVKEINKRRVNQNEKITLSDLLDSMVQYFLIAYTLGEFKKPLTQLRAEFDSFLRDSANKVRNTK